MNKKMISLLVTLALSFAAKSWGATITVDSADGGYEIDDGLCSIYEAVDNANKNTAYWSDCAKGESSGDEIVFDESVKTICLENELVVSDDLTITGNSLYQTTIDGGNTKAGGTTSCTKKNTGSLIYADGSSGSFELTIKNMQLVNAAETAVYSVNLSDFDIENSVIAYNYATYNGAGIFIYPSTSTVTILNINRSVISNNIADDTGSGIYAQDAKVYISGTMISENQSAKKGGGLVIYDGILEMSESTVSNNEAMNGGGGGIYISNSEMIITNSTIVGNKSSNVSFGGAGVYIYTTGSSPSTAVNIINSTIYGNEELAGDGGGIYYSGSKASIVNIYNSIVAGNTSTDSVTNDCGDSSGTTKISSSGYNFINTTGCDYKSVSTDITSGSLSDLALQPLTDNGGPTETMALGLGSVAIDAVKSGCTVTTDQRGGDRDALCDIGAYEYNAVISEETTGGTSTSGSTTSGTTTTGSGTGGGTTTTGGSSTSGTESTGGSTTSGGSDTSGSDTSGSGGGDPNLGDGQGGGGCSLIVE